MGEWNGSGEFYCTESAIRKFAKSRIQTRISRNEDRGALELDLQNTDSVNIALKEARELRGFAEFLQIFRKIIFDVGAWIGRRISSLERRWDN